MDPKPDDAWFYSKGGERTGPVSFSELQEIILNNQLDPMRDLVWKQGMEKWKKVGEVASTFAAKPKPKEELKPEPTEEPKVEPKAEPAAAKAEAKPEPKEEPKPAPKPAPAPEPTSEPKAKTKPTPSKAAQAFKPQPKKPEPAVEEKKKAAKKDKAPGVGRFGYLFVTFVGPFIFVAALAAIVATLQSSVSPGTLSAITSGAMLLGLLIAIIVKLMRLTNLSMSRWCFLLSFIPVINIWLEYRCFACPPGYADTKDLDTAGIVLAIIFWLFILITTICFGAMGLLAYGLMNDPEAQRQIFDALEQMRVDVTSPTQ